MPNYSSVVRFLRLAVPTAGALLLIVFFLWPTLSSLRLPHFDKAKISSDRVELVHPHYEGKDENGQRYVLTADSAIQVRATPDLLQLILPTATLEKNDNSEGPHVTAKAGVYQNKTGQLTLTDGVVLTTPQGDKFNTAAADVDLKNKTIDVKQPISGGGPTLDLSGQGLQYDEDDGLLTVAGPAKLVLYQNPGTNEKPTAPVAPATAPTGLGG